ncbi:unnamed protein product [Pieris brassicae]|uniref:PNT domain-containing protein n=1 Tax=Pieris brassicae TaxID=7116 RepID=A0A9P0XIE3_PIEBR|nr:unnamed protein product [Pieris brassicae]
MEPRPPPSSPSDTDSDSGDETVPADPETWVRRDVVRCVRWAARTFRVHAPRRHLLPSSGAALLQLTEEHWLQVCEGKTEAARIFHTYVQHVHAEAKGRPPPEPLPEHQASTSAATHTNGGGAAEWVRGGAEQRRSQYRSALGPLLPLKVLVDISLKSTASNIYFHFIEIGIVGRQWRFNHISENDRNEDKLYFSIPI